jgi:S1-C subfamily serine protease
MIFRSRLLLPAILLAGILIGLPLPPIEPLPFHAPHAAMASGAHAGTVDAKLDLAWLQYAKESTVSVCAPKGGHGSGVAYHRDGSEVFVLTAAHVAKKSDDGWFTIAFGLDNSDYALDGHVIKIDLDADLAILCVHDSAQLIGDLQLATSMPKDGDVVIAIGYPRDIYPAIARVGFVYNFLLGRILHSAGLWFGDSGGPLLDKTGKIIGINIHIQWRDHTPDSNQGSAVSLESLNKFLEN